MQAEIYTKSDCPYCVKAKELLNERQVDYREYIVSSGFNEDTPLPHQQYVTKGHLIERLPAAKTVPQIWVDSHYIGGYTELAKYFDSL